MTQRLYEGSTRFATAEFGRLTRHSFSFGRHYDPANLGFGPLVCHNDDLLEPAAGYPDHPHRDLEIVTWVLSGALVHADDEGHHHVLHPGQVQVLSAGDGVRHSEFADAAAGPTRFIQVWVTPDEPGGTPAYRTTGAGDLRGGLVDVAGGDGLRLGRTGARLSVARLEAGDQVQLPTAVHQHVFAATGAVVLDGQRLAGGDAVRITGAAGSDVRAEEPGELLVWSFDD
ncbi:MAG: pirin family protein [Nocardioides sp.]|uniref:pirin family protein n=1 Tax=Nocardioides sp. TaxID=35761 RepID=UPI003F01BC0D